MRKGKTRRWKHLNHFRAVESKRFRQVRRSRRRTTDSETKLLDSYETRIVGPNEFSLEGSHHDDVVNFLEDLRKSVSAGTKIVVLDFRKTVRLVAGATLLLFSELQRLKSMYPRTGFRCIPSKDDAVNQALQHLKIFESLGYESAVVPTRQDVVSWKKASSSAIDGKRVGTLIETFESLKGDVAGQLFRGASEAMMNSMNHAYMDRRHDGLPTPDEKKWWMFCRQDADYLYVAVCDLGIGIPRSLPLKYPIEIIEQAMHVLSRGWVQTDARLIQAAMELARTRTDREGRGLGLHDLKRIVDEVVGGVLYLFSNKGVVIYRDGGYSRRNFVKSIKGTVVVWLVPLNPQVVLEVNPDE